MTALHPNQDDSHAAVSTAVGVRPLWWTGTVAQAPARYAT